jgi:3-hydroxybutyrate dehydrogenase
MLDHWFSRDSRYQPNPGSGPEDDLEESTRQLLAEMQPFGAFTTSEQFRALVVFLCTHWADNLRGACFLVRGGWLAQ